MAQKTLAGITFVLIGLCIGVHTEGRTNPTGSERQLQAARALETMRRYEEALRVYREAYKVAPEHREVLQGLDRTLSKLGRFDELVDLLKKAIQRAPKDGYFRMRLGEVLYDAGQPNEAEQWWDSMVVVGADHRHNYTLVAREYLQRGDAQKAMETYRKARAHFGERSLFAKQIADLSAATRDFASAASEYLLYLEEQPSRADLVRELLSGFPRDRETIEGVTEVLKEAVLQAPKYVEWQKLLAEYYLMTDRPWEAWDGMLSMVDRGSANETLFLQWAERVARQGDPALGTKVYQEVIARFPKSRQMPRMILGLARAQEASGEYAEAVASYRRLADEVPHTTAWSEALYRMARIERDKLGNVDAALGLFQKLAERPEQAPHLRSGQAPFAVEAAFEMAECLLIKGDLEGASEIYKRMSRQAKEPSVREEALFRWAEITFLRGDFEEAVKLSEALIRTFPEGMFVNDALKLAVFLEENGEPEEALVLFAQAQWRRRQREFEEAEKLLDRLAEAFPTAQVRDDALFLSSALSMDKGAYPEAIERCRELIERYPDSPLAPEAQQRIGRIYDEALREPNQALVEYERVLSDYPGTLLEDEVRRRIRALREKG